jgi:hypothetical protein
MRARKHRNTVPRYWLATAMLAAMPLANAQVPVDAEGTPYGDFTPGSAGDALGNEDIPLRTAGELEELVAPVALYPDDLLAIVLPASTYPLQLVEAARFLEALEQDPALEPDENWDDAVVALTNYPEVVELLNEDLDWTWRLGEAVVAQQEDVIAAVEAFRDRAYAAGNLKSDTHQTVSHSDDGIIEIVPMEDDIIYVPYYEPAEVVVYQPRPVYYYYPRAYPVYYYPYPSTYAFHRDYFWGVTTAFTIGWYTDSLHVFHHSYRGHPYYGRYYWDRWWYRRPSINVYNTTYVNNTVHRSRDYYRSGDVWQSRHHRRLRSDDGRITRNRYYPGDADRQRQTSSITRSNSSRDGGHETIRFRERPDRTAFRDNAARARDATTRQEFVRTRADRSEPVRSRRDADRAARIDRSTPVRTEPLPASRTETQRSSRAQPERSSSRAQVQRSTRSEPARVQRSEAARVARSEPKRVNRAAPSRPDRARPSRPERPAKAEPKRSDGRSGKSRDRSRPRS